MLMLAAALWGFENVNMNPLLAIENNNLVVRWSTGGFDHYNVRWSANGGSARQEERGDDKRFNYLGTFHQSVVYRVAVQGCISHFAASSECTSWDEVSCGSPCTPCDGLAPRPIINGTGLCLDVHAPDQHRNGGRVQLWACNGSDQQLWTLRNTQVVSLAGKMPRR